MEGFKVKVTNHLTGELTEIEIKGGDHAMDVLDQLQASYKALDTAIANIKNYIDVWMGEDDQMQIGNFMAKREQRASRAWTIDGLRAIGLDDDAIAVASKVNMTTARALVDEAIERGDIKPNAKKELNESAEVSFSKPFLVFRRVK